MGGVEGLRDLRGGVEGWKGGGLEGGGMEGWRVGGVEGWEGGMGEVEGWRGRGGGLERWRSGVNTWMLFLSGQSRSVHTTMHVPAAV